VENPTPGVTNPADKSPDQIEREMGYTREAITEKVSLLESQVLGTVEAVTGTVKEVKEAITAAPTAVSDTVKQTVEAVKDTVRGTVDSVKDTIRSFRVTECIQNNPWAAVGTSAAGGFLAGFFLLGGGSTRRPIMARGHDEPAPRGRPGTADAGYASAAPATPSYAAEPREHKPGLMSQLFGSVTGQLRDIAEQAISSAMATLKKSVSTTVPQVVESAVHQVAEKVTAPGGDTGRANGPSYSARA